ncbi:NTF2 fold immunity protein [Luteibacter aegosomatis]|uniref:NTF2 fold immunity protein n=1 Tax=Luteibacter aegosomatis TaxID=2911537 RepID=UPI001FF9A179|nr:NTF2 fold immunity protein [Luteibacter aegosomatis]UPG84326.1 NTF2 fold immunity protein [Luteibacter aegosomatis]
MKSEVAGIPSLGPLATFPSMIRRCSVFLELLIASANVNATSANHSDYVPDKRTAEAVGLAVLQARFGEAEVKKQLPLTVIHGRGNVWIVQGNASQPTATGGGMAVWIDQNSGCIVNVMAYMK